MECKVNSDPCLIQEVHDVVCAGGVVGLKVTGLLAIPVGVVVEEVGVVAAAQLLEARLEAEALALRQRVVEVAPGEEVGVVGGTPVADALRGVGRRVAGYVDLGQVDKI